MRNENENEKQIRFLPCWFIDRFPPRLPDGRFRFPLIFSLICCSVEFDRAAVESMLTDVSIGVSFWRRFPLSNFVRFFIETEGSFNATASFVVRRFDWRTGGARRFAGVVTIGVGNGGEWRIFVDGGTGSVFNVIRIGIVGRGCSIVSSLKWCEKSWVWSILNKRKERRQHRKRNRRTFRWFESPLVRQCVRLWEWRSVRFAAKKRKMSKSLRMKK